MKTAKQQCASFDVARGGDELREYAHDVTMDAERDLNFRVQCYDDAKEPEYFVDCDVEQLAIEFFDEGDSGGFVPLSFGREIEREWAPRWFRATWKATLIRCERFDGRKTVAVYAITVEQGWN